MSSSTTHDSDEFLEAAAMTLRKALSRAPPSSLIDHDQLFNAGMKIRKEVAGEAYVSRALQGGQSEFAYPQQQLITEWVWGNIWSRPGLDRKQRSLLNIGIMVGLKSWPELGIHIRGAIRNGLTELELREALLQSTVYCGAPAGLEAFQVAEGILNDMVEKGEYVRTMGGLSEDAKAKAEAEAEAKCS